jgi:hypothetical protein
MPGCQYMLKFTASLDAQGRYPSTLNFLGPPARSLDQSFNGKSSS